MNSPHLAVIHSSMVWLLNLLLIKDFAAMTMGILTLKLGTKGHH